MAIDNKSESASVFNFGMFPAVVWPWTDSGIGPDESSNLWRAYGEAGAPIGSSGKMTEQMAFGLFGSFGMLP